MVVVNGLTCLEPLLQEQVPAGPVDVGDRGVPEGMEGVEAVEPGFDLPGQKSKPVAALADPNADWEQKWGSRGSNPSRRVALWARNFRSLPVSASGRKTSPVRPPLAISGLPLVAGKSRPNRIAQGDRTESTQAEAPGSRHHSISDNRLVPIILCTKRLGSHAELH